MFLRHPNNPLISPHDVKPSRPDFEIIGTFNAGVTTFNGQTLLLMRVAERPINHSDGTIFCPHLDENGVLTITAIQRDDPDYDTHDPRKIEHKQTGDLLLTSISHFRLARSVDGVHFSVDDQPWMQGAPPYESYGIEDPRITQIGDRYYINYTAVSRTGIATALVSTHDFVSIERHGLIFAPSNRDVTLFPERIGGQYVCYHRPMPGMLGRMNIWMATSPDLIHWGDLRLVLEAPSGRSRVGGGAPPIKTEQGWLSIYHAADAQDRYTLSAFLTALDAPERIIAQSTQPILEAEQPYETQGFYKNVVFTCGVVAEGDNLRLYYGAADESIALAETSLSTLLQSLQPLED
ncbi:MAG: glycoside hydrolase family 130 protein [Anaerolineae bacterium]|nr:glycoside hydrolase family 130 protein [Anaerolineae bacterium]